jgi:hypothetical protein
MRIGRFAFPAALAAGLAIAPFSATKAQAYYAPCSPFPLTWPFCAAGAIVGAAVDIATAPVWLLSGAPPPFSPAAGYYGPRPYVPPPAYYYGPRPYAPAPPYYYWPR